MDRESNFSIMKKLLSLLMLLSTMGLMAQKTFTVDVNNTTGFPQGVAVFLHEAYIKSPVPTILNKEFYTQVAYTSGNGVATFTVPTSTDTLVYGVYDCNGVFYEEWCVFPPNQSWWQDTIVMTTCLPQMCNVVVRANQTPVGLFAEGVALRDSLWAGVNGTYDDFFYVNGVQYPGTKIDGNQAFLQLPSTTFPTGSLVVSYTRHDSMCGVGDSDTLWFVGAPGLSCNADFFIDTINSGAFNGQLIIGENSTSSAGSIIDWMWDFGDGASSNVQFPTHTYASVAATYNLCLTITAVDGTDTCSSTYCMPVQFDSTGAPVFKTGFTVNVVDPKTFSVEEDLLSAVALYPNPSNGEATLMWDSSLRVEKVDVLNLNGQLVKTVQPEGNVARVNELPSGVYFVRIHSTNAVGTQKLIVQ